MHLPPLKGIVAFEVVARLGSVNKAVDELNVTASAVSHQIANLEGFVGRRLFERTSRGLMLTPVGERYRNDVAGALALIASAAHNARVRRCRSPARPLRTELREPLADAASACIPRCARRLADPAFGSVQRLGFSRGEIDLDIRYGTVRGGDLHVETIFREEILPLASPDLLKGLAIREPTDLLAQPLILSAVNVVQWPRWFAANSVPLSPGTYALTFDRTSMALDAAVQGLGIALDSGRLAEQYLRRNELAPVFADRKGIEVHAHHIVYPRQHGKWKKVERFVAWIRDEAGKAK